MPQAAEPITCPYEPTPHRIRWTRAQYDTFRDTGVLNGRYELIDGEIISKMGVNPPHSGTLIAVRLWLSFVFGGSFVRTETTVDVGEADPEHNEPQPDVSVTVKPHTAYFDTHPAPTDVVLAVEVSDSTLRFDRSKKALLYSLAGIQEYWVIDIAGRRVYVHRHPTPSGYLEVIAYEADEKVATLTRPEETIQVANLLPPI